MEIQVGHCYRLRNGTITAPLQETRWPGILKDDKSGKIFNTCDGTHGDESMLHSYVTNDNRFDCVEDVSPKKWKHLSDIEKGQLLLAEHEGADIQILEASDWAPKCIHTKFLDNCCYRIKPVPCVHFITSGKYLFSFSSVDGKVDCKSVAMSVNENA